MGACVLENPSFSAGGETAGGSGGATSAGVSTETGGGTSGGSSGGSTGSSTGSSTGATGETTGETMGVATGATTTTTGATGDTEDTATSGTTGGDGPPNLCGITPKELAAALKDGEHSVDALHGLNTIEYEADPVITPDGKTLYFVRGGDLWRGTRGELGVPFGAPEPANDLGLNTASDENKLALTEDLQTAVLSALRPDGNNDLDLWLARRHDPSETFGTPVLQGHSSGLGDDHDPHLSGDGLRLYYAPVRNGLQQIRRAERESLDKSFGEGVVVDGLAGEGWSDADPWLSADERVIVFASTRDGLGGRKIFIAERASRDEPFAPPMTLAGVNLPGAHYDGDPFVFEPKGGGACELFFASDRPGGKGSGDLYWVVLPKG